MKAKEAILEILKRDSFNKLWHELLGDECERAVNPKFTHIIKNIAVSLVKKKQQNPNEYFRGDCIKISLADQNLLADFLLVLRGYEPFYQAIIQDQVIKIPVEDIECFINNKIEFEPEPAFEPITKQGFLNLKKQHWVNWPCGARAAEIQNLLFNYFQHLTLEDRRDIFITHFNNTNLNQLLLWVDRKDFIDELKKNQCALLSEVLTAAVGDKFQYKNFINLHSDIVTYNRSSSLVRSSESRTLAKILEHLTSGEQPSKITYMKKLNLYCAMQTYMEYYSTFLINSKTPLARLIQDAHDTLSEDLNNGVLALYTLVIPSINQIAKSRFDYAVMGSDSNNTYLTNFLPLPAPPLLDNTQTEENGIIFSK